MVRFLVRFLVSVRAYGQALSVAAHTPRPQRRTAPPVRFADRGHNILWVLPLGSTTRPPLERTLQGKAVEGGPLTSGLFVEPPLAADQTLSLEDGQMLVHRGPGDLAGGSDGRLAGIAAARVSVMRVRQRPQDQFRQRSQAALLERPDRRKMAHCCASPAGNG